MGLFGPLSSAIYGDTGSGFSGLYGVDPDDPDFAAQLGLRRPRPVPNRYLLPSYEPADGMNAGSTAAPPMNAIAPTLAPPLPPMQMLGTFTTRRTQWFGPLAGISI